jgi:hypothetical protein
MKRARVLRFAVAMLFAASSAHDAHLPSVSKDASAASRWHVGPVATLPRDSASRLSPAIGLTGIFGIF